MSFSPAFTVGQAASDPSAITIEDTSSGSDILITGRLIYITDNNGDPVVPAGTSTDYISWAYGTNPYTISDLLTQDLAVTIRVDWVNSGGSALYTDSDKFCLREFNIQNFIYLIQQQALTPGVVQDTTYFSNLAQYYINIQGASIMVVVAGDLSGSQNLLNMATQMLNNQDYYF